MTDAWLIAAYTDWAAQSARLKGKITKGLFFAFNKKVAEPGQNPALVCMKKDTDRSSEEEELQVKKVYSHLTTQWQSKSKSY